MQTKRVAAIALAASLACAHGSAIACSRILWGTNDQAKVVARTVDLYMSDNARFTVYPRGIERRGIADDARPLTWKSRYASIAITAFGAATSDGMNEKGLSANLLYLSDTKYEARDSRPAVSNLLWAQYMLDNYATVNEALAALKSIQVVPVAAAGRPWPVHLSLADADGDSAIVEFIDGKPVIHHGKEFAVMTNEPAYAEQLANLRKYRMFGGNAPMPGDIDPLSRFVRAASYLKTLPKPNTVREAAAGVYSVARTVAVPFGAHDTSGGDSVDTWPTLWFSIADLTHRTYYFQSTTSANLYWADFTKLRIEEGAPILSVDAYDYALSGDISDQLKPSPAR